jgi:hypothetical protein
MEPRRGGNWRRDTNSQAITYPVCVITNAGTIAAANNLGKVGSPHTVSGFAFTGTGTPTYRWLRDDVAIAGAISAGYTTVAADAGTNLKRETVVTNSGGTDTDETAAQAVTFEFEPMWVDNNGNAYVYLDGSGIGTDNRFFDMFFLVKRMTGNPSNTCRIHQTRSARHDIRWESNGRLRVILKDSAGTNLVDWTSTSAVDVAGEWLFHIAADLDTVPVVTFTKAERIDGVMQAWAAIPGSFTTGPTAGTIDHLSSGADFEFTLLQSYLVDVNMPDCDFAFAWFAYAAPVTDAAMAANGVLEDPLTVGAPIVLIRGPAANLTNDEGSANVTFTLANSFTDTI